MSDATAAPPPQKGWLNFDLLFYPLNDDDSTKKAIIAVLLAAASSVTFGLAMIPLWGYGLQVLRGTINSGEPPLPEWEDWDHLFKEGLRALVVRLFYLLPVGVVYGVMFVAWLALFPGMALLNVVGNSSVATAAGIGSFLVVMAIMMGGSVLVLPLMLAGHFFTQMGLVRYVVTGSFKTAFDLRGVWKLSRFGFRYFGLALLAWVGVYLVSNVATSLLSATFILLPLVPFVLGAVLAYQVVMAGALYGAAYNQIKTALATAGTILPDFDGVS